MDERSLVDYFPIVTTILAAGFAVVLFQHWRRKSQARYLLWWTLGVAVYGLGTVAEALTTLYGWKEPVFRLWYISGALMGGVFLAQGTVYLLIKKQKADRMTMAVAAYLVVASSFVILTPIERAAVETYDLSGKVMAWQWVRAFTPFINLYAVIFLVGGALWSAWRYWRRSDGSRNRAWGNLLIAVGAILPGIGGASARFGEIRVLYVTELIGLVLIWFGYRVIVGDTKLSIHPTQREAAYVGETARR